MKNLLNIIGALAFWGLVILLAWLYLEGTPSQLSGESDWTVKESEDAGEEYCPGVQ